MRFRAATYNIRKAIGLDWSRRPDRILAVLDEIGADVVALQEADRRFGARTSAIPPMMLADAGWRVAPVAAHTGGIGWRGNAILFGPRLEARAARPLVLPGLEPRGAAYAELALEGRALTVVGAHLGLTPGPRRRQIEALLAAAPEGHAGATLLMGDMNEPRIRAGALRLLEPHWRLAPPVPSFHARRPLAALDRIAHGRALRLLSVHVHASALARQASDHLPVVADFALESAP
jgi:endonuclease/exonuclease/phosphatase family metal-dependent hydrolase